MSDEDIVFQNTVYNLAISPDFAHDHLCFAACESGLFRSENGGLNWEDALQPLNLTSKLSAAAVAFSPDFASDHQVFAGVQGGILHSYDGGKTWNITILPAPVPLVVSLVFSPAYAQDSVILAGTLEDGVLRSTDRGSHWSSWNFGLLDLNTYDLVLSPDFEKDETAFVATESGIFRSTNGARAWRSLDFPIEFAPVISLAISPDFALDGHLFAGTEGNGLFHSTDRGKSWSRLGKTAITGSVNKIVLPPTFAQQPQILLLQEEQLRLSSNGGKNWAQWNVDLDEEESITTVAAPFGLDKKAPLLIGLTNGQVRLVNRRS
jgi:BNR/Asp-box repeat